VVESRKPTMTHTIAEKILAAKSDASEVFPGPIVDACPDLVMSHTATWRSVAVIRQLGATTLFDPDRIAIVLDHVAPARTEKYAADQRTSRAFACEHGIEKFYDWSAGAPWPGRAPSITGTSARSRARRGRSPS